MPSYISPTAPESLALGLSDFIPSRVQLEVGVREDRLFSAMDMEMSCAASMHR